MTTVRSRRPRLTAREVRIIEEEALRHGAHPYVLNQARGMFDLTGFRMNGDDLDLFRAEAAKLGGHDMSAADAMALADRMGVPVYVDAISPRPHMIARKVKAPPGTQEYSRGLFRLYGETAVKDAWAAWLYGHRADEVRSRSRLPADAIKPIIDHFSRLRPEAASCSVCGAPRASGRPFYVRRTLNDPLLCGLCGQMTALGEGEIARRMAEVVELYDQGLSIHAIADATGHSRRFIGRAKKRATRTSCAICGRIRRPGVRFGGFAYQTSDGQRRTLATCVRCIDEQAAKGVGWLPDPDEQEEVLDDGSSEESE